MTAASVSSGGHDGGPARDWRDKLAAALNGTAHLGCEEFSPADIDSGCPDCEDVFRAADAILPTVAGIVAGELEQISYEIRARFGWAGGYGKHLRDRAAALRADEIDPT